MRSSLMSKAAVVIGVMTFTLGSAWGSPAPTAANKWTQLADQTYTESVNAVAKAESSGQYVRSQFVAPLAWYSGLKFGWKDQRTQDWLNKVYRLRTPSKGYGLGRLFDAYSDGTTNPANTAYTITGAWHVGRTLIAGYDGGGVPKERVQEVASWLAKIPLAGGGKCASYSETTNDKGKPCVWNVSAAGAWFLWSAEQRGLIPATDKDAVLAKVRSWRNEVRAHYSTALGGWTYQAGSSGLQDPWHNVATAAPMYALDPSIGKTALAGEFAKYPANAANADLLPLDCAKAEGTFQAIKATATKPATSPLDVLQSRAGFAPLLMQTGITCGQSTTPADVAPTRADRAAAIVARPSRSSVVNGHRPSATTTNGSTGATSVQPAGSENSSPFSSWR
jgi:hypothetical protein